MGKPATPLGAWGKIAVTPIAPKVTEGDDPFSRVQAPAPVIDWMREHPEAMASLAVRLTKRQPTVSPTFEAFTRYRDPGTGRSISIRARGTTEDKAKTALLKKVADRGEGCANSGGALTPNSKVGLLIDAYLEHLTQDPGNRRPQTIKRKRDVVRRTVRPQISSLRIRELTAVPIDRVIKGVVDSGRLSEAKETTIILREILRLSNRLGLTTLDPKIIVPNAPRPAKAGSAEKPVRYLTAEQVDRLRKALHHWHVERLGKSGPRPDGQPMQILEVMTGAALRPGEAAALVMRNLCIDGANVERPFLIVDGTIVLRDGSVHRQPETKTGRARTVALPAAAVKAIRDRLAAIAELEREGKRPARTPDTLLFGTRKGTPWQDSNLRRSFSYATNLLDDLGVAVTEFSKLEFTPHMARRSAATAVYHHETGGRAATRAMLGHQDDTQLPAYVHDLGLEAPDFTSITALDELLPILDLDAVSAHGDDV